MFEKIRESLAKYLQIDESKITLDSHITNDLGADSTHTAELLFSIEREYGIEISDEDAEAMQTVRDVVERLKNYGLE